jgi:pyridoxamine 5'-phosphate oxidase family protein
MSSFSDAELRYLADGPKLARIATVGPDGMPHVVPSGWSYNGELDVLVLGGHQLESTKKFRDVRATGRAAVVVDDVLPQWRPRAVAIRGRAEAIAGADGSPAVIMVHPDQVASWGLDAASSDEGGG